jgi:hypothetical protein
VSFIKARLAEPHSTIRIGEAVYVVGTGAIVADDACRQIVNVTIKSRYSTTFVAWKSYPRGEVRVLALSEQGGSTRLAKIRVSDDWSYVVVSLTDIARPHFDCGIPADSAMHSIPLPLLPKKRGSEASN